ncbi:MAG: hypothetical protein H6618_05045 [Deltaproteobacteria bacterium]|nr:hypothetical protein [Deltaproteobacteria bacterium]
MARDFGLKVSENAVRTWVAQAADTARMSDTNPIVTNEFSGVLCIDEAYSGRLAVLFATDPNRNDALIGYLVQDGSFNQTDVEKFLENLKEEGLEPDQVVTDESSLYPSSIRSIWPNVRHQLCLFHVAQKLTEAAKIAVREVRSLLPVKPPEKMRVTKESPEKVAAVFHLRSQGMGFRAIAEKIGISKNSVKKWLRDPDFVESRYGMTPGDASELALTGASLNTTAATHPPYGWKSWEDVDMVRLALGRMAFWVSSRTLSEKRVKIFNAVLQTPAGAEIAEIRDAVVGWQKIWQDLNASITAAKDSWDIFKSLPIHKKYKSFNRFKAKLSDDLFISMTHYSASPKFENTNNSAERYARKFKKIQKTRYRIRSKTAAEDQLLLDSLMNRKPFRHEELSKRDPFLL